MNKNLLRNVAVILVSVVLSGLTALAVVKSSAPKLSSAVSTDSSKFRTVNLQQTDYPDFSYAAESAVDAVVYVKVTIKNDMSQYQIDPFFRFFFGDQG
ncbi:MAG: hypothetical protein WCR48_08145, partial [Bacteroidales bacterium]